MVFGDYEWLKGREGQSKSLYGVGNCCRHSVPGRLVCSIWLSQKYLSWSPIRFKLVSGYISVLFLLHPCLFSACPVFIFCCQIQFCLVHHQEFWTIGILQDILKQVQLDHECLVFHSQDHWRVTCICCAVPWTLIQGSWWIFCTGLLVCRYSHWHLEDRICKQEV